MKTFSLLVLLFVATIANARDYPATVVAVYDGDTITVDIGLGLGVFLKGQRIRLNRIDTPEMRGPDKARGKVSRDYLRSRILGKSVTIQTDKDKTGKFGRLLGEVILDGVNLNDELVRKGLGVYRTY